MKPSVPIIFSKRLFMLLFLGFILATVAGTLSHECGHYIAGRVLGYKGLHISYAFTSMGYHPTYVSPAGRQTDELLFIAGGPAETIAAGTIGLLLLYIRYPKTAGKEQTNSGKWLLIFGSLFWLRELFNFVCAAALNIFGMYRYTGDEFVIAAQLHLNGWALSAALALIAFAILVVVTFKFVPGRERLTFLTAGLTGGIAGAILWLVILGPVLMPK